MSDPAQLQAPAAGTRRTGWPRQWAVRVVEELGGRRDFRSLRAALRQVPREVPGIGVVRPIVCMYLRIWWMRVARR